MVGVGQELAAGRHDVMVRSPEREEETIVFHLPKDWTATELPHAAAWHSEALDGAVQVTSAPGTVTIHRMRQAAFAVAPAP